jgi:hypothetical protein
LAFRRFPTFNSQIDLQHRVHPVLFLSLICNERTALTTDEGRAVMIPASELVPRVADITGLPYSTVYGVKRRFVETGIWPSSRDAHVPDLTVRQVVLMLLVLLADVPAKDAAATANAYYALKNEDGEKLGDCLVRIIDGFKTNSPLAQIAYKSRLELDCGRPRACLNLQCTDGHEEILFGVQRAQWEDLIVRRSMTISGKCLYDLATGLHYGRWPEDSVIAA